MKNDSLVKMNLKAPLEIEIKMAGDEILNDLHKIVGNKQKAKEILVYLLETSIRYSFEYDFAL